MITRFRVEGRNSSQEALSDELTIAATQVMQILRASEENYIGEWECTDEHSSGNEKNGWIGRMVFVFHHA